MSKIKFLRIILFTILALVILSLSYVVNAENKISSVHYLTYDGYVRKVKDKTTVASFLDNIMIDEGTDILKVYDGSKEVIGDTLVKTGMKLKFGEKEYIIVVRGDINKDGILSATDLSQLKVHMTNITPVTGERLQACDVNSNDEITAVDLSLLKLLLVGIDPDEEGTTGYIKVTPNTTDPAKEVVLSISVNKNIPIEYDNIEISLDGGKNYTKYDKPEDGKSVDVTIKENMNVKIKLTSIIENVEYEGFPEIKGTLDEETGEYILEEGFDENLLRKENETYEQYIQRLLDANIITKKVTTETLIMEEMDYQVKNIDNIAPNPVTFKITDTTTNSMSINAEAKDKYKDYEGNIKENTDIAGIKMFQYKVSDNKDKLKDATWQDISLNDMVAVDSNNDGIVEKFNAIFTIKDLKENTSYYVAVQAIDFAGNSTEAQRVGNTNEIVNPDEPVIIVPLPSNIRATQSTTEYTNQDVIVTLECNDVKDKEYRIQARLNNGNWEDGEEGVVTKTFRVTHNGNVFSRIADNNDQAGEEKSIKIANIDKLPPLEFEPKLDSKTANSIKVSVTVNDAEATDEYCKSGIDKYTYRIKDQKGIKQTYESTNKTYTFTGLDTENKTYYIEVEAKDKAGNIQTSETLSVVSVNDPEPELIYNPGPDPVPFNPNAPFAYDNPAIPAGFKPVNTDGAKWPSGWNNGLVIEDDEGNQFVWVPVDGTNVKYEKGILAWDCKTNYGMTDIKGDDLPKTLTSVNEKENTQINKYHGFYVSRYEAGNDDNVLASKQGMKVINNVSYVEAKTYAESMYKMLRVKSGLLTGTMWDTMTTWIKNQKGENYVKKNANTGNYYVTAFKFSGKYATGPNSSKEKRSAYKNGTDVNKTANSRVLLTTGIVNQFKVKNLYDTAGNVAEYTAEYMKNGEHIARGGNYYWVYDSGVGLGTALREYINVQEGEKRNETGFRVALYITDAVAEVGVFETYNRTMDGKAATYKNPVIPAGFAAVNDGADWGDGNRKAPEYDKGLVIEDKKGNQFVWVPVDGTNVKYEKWATIGTSYTETTGDDVPSVVTNTWKEQENTQVGKYGGFYIARYESSVSEAGEAQSQKNQDVTVNKKYSEMKTLAEGLKIMVNKKEMTKVKTGLLTGKQWDTAMKWIALEKGYSVVTDNSSTIGTYGSALQQSGKKAVKNIYDIAGNAWEMTAEYLANGKRVYRGGVYSDKNVAVAYRGAKDGNTVDKATGFRMILYVTGPIKGGVSVVPIQDDTALNGTKGVPPIPVAKGNVTFTQSPASSVWTNQDVKLTIKNAATDYMVEYQVNGKTEGKWVRGTEYTAKQNCTVYVRLTNSKNQVSTAANAIISYEIKNIDKVAPNAFKPSISDLKWNTFKMTCNVTDNLSGVQTYKYYIKGKLVKTSTSNTYTVTGLNEKTKYDNIYVEAIDKAGNLRKSTVISVTTLSKSVPFNQTASLGKYVKYSFKGIDKWRVLDTIKDGDTKYVRLVSTKLLYQRWYRDYYYKHSQNTPNKWPVAEGNWGNQWHIGYRKKIDDGEWDFVRDGTFDHTYVKKIDYLGSPLGIYSDKAASLNKRKSCAENDLNKLRKMGQTYNKAFYMPYTEATERQYVQHTGGQRTSGHYVYMTTIDFYNGNLGSDNLPDNCDYYVIPTLILQANAKVDNSTSGDAQHPWVLVKD